MSFYSNYVKRLNVIDMSVAEQKAYIDGFAEPKTAFERAFLHYRCRFYGVERRKLVFLNFLGFFLCGYYLLRFCRNRRKNCTTEKHDAVLIDSRSMNISYEDKMPDEIYREFPDFYAIEYHGYPDRPNGSVDGRTIRYWLRLWKRHPFAGYFNLNCLLHLGSVCQIMRRYAPRAILNYRVESNFTSSVITDYCERLGVEYICFMHGDYVCSKDRAFVRFSRMYLWDRQYRDIFLWSRCPEEQFRYYDPKMYRLPASSVTVPSFFLTYYCDGDFDRRITAIRDRLAHYVEEGRRCKIRPHPRFSDVAFLKKLFDGTGVVIESCADVRLEDSVADSEYIVSMRSTVLMQAYYAGKTIVVDDLSNPALFGELNEMMAIFMRKPHLILSELN